MEVKETQELQYDYENVPPEIWLNIRSRLPIKDVFKYRCVAKSWNPIPGSIRRNIGKQPLCGLILWDTTLELASDHKSPMSYLPKGANESISITTNKKPLAVSSGFDTLYLRDVFFNLSPLFCLRQGESAVDNGLILIYQKNGHYYVYNPVTTQLFKLPMSPPHEELAGVAPPQKKSAFIVSLGADQCGLAFIVMRVIPRVRAAEFFYSKTCTWSVFKLMTHIDDDDDEVLNSSWCCENYVFVNKTQTLFFLTEKDQGLAVGFDLEKATAHVYHLPLPEVVKGGFRNSRLGGNRECLYLSYYDNDGGVWFWKRNGERLTCNDPWVLLLEIGKTPKLSRSLEHSHDPLFQLLKGGNSIFPIGFYPRHAIALLRVKSTIFTYDLMEKKLDKFAEISDEDFKLSMIVLPYIPFVAPFQESIDPGLMMPIFKCSDKDKNVEE